MRRCGGLVYVYHLLASQALPREPAVAPPCAFGLDCTTLVVAVPPALPSPALEAHCSAVSMPVAHQHRTYRDDRCRNAVPIEAANCRAFPFTTSPSLARVAVGLAASAVSTRLL
jgi:hypothetical protein